MSTGYDFSTRTISDEQVAQYRRDGFTMIDSLISGDDLANLREAVERAVEIESSADHSEPTNERDAVYATIFNQKVNLWRRHEEVAKFTLSPSFGRIANQLAGQPMRIWHDQALFKEPGKGNNKTPWHQDAVYWPHQDRQLQTTIWIALEDVTVQSGCMAFLPGSHHLGVLPAVDLAAPHDVIKDSENLRSQKPAIQPLKAGSVTFHNGLTLHYAGPNRSQSPRRAFAIIYMPDGTVYDGGPHIVTDGQGLMPGAHLNSSLFPSI